MENRWDNSNATEYDLWFDDNVTYLDLVWREEGWDENLTLEDFAYETWMELELPGEFPEDRAEYIPVGRE